MVTELRQALEALGQLPEEDQRQIAQRVLEEIEQREWDALVGSPRSRAFLKRLIAEAKAGEIEEGGMELP
jgi:DnaJ-domain-containing protein 1